MELQRTPAGQDIETGFAGSPPSGGRGRSSALRLLSGLLLVNGLLMLPWWILAGGPRAPWLALEAALLVGVFSLLPDRAATRRAALGASAALALLLTVDWADVGLRLSLGRPLNLYLDVWLLDAVKNLLVGTLGPLPALLAAGFALAVGALGVWALARFLASIAGGGLARGPLLARADLVWPPRPGRSAGVAGLAGLTLVVVAFERSPSLAPIFTVPTVRVVRDQTARFHATLEERDAFAEALALYPGSYRDEPALLARLEGRDVIFGFVESYGISALHDPRYAGVVGPRLDDLEHRAARAGLHVATGRLVASSQGGMSWLAHGSLLSGLWLGNQLLYDMMLASGRETLIDDFRAAGYRTVALMPAITMPWPEGERLGYDEVYTFAEIDYAGPALNWVTMPDQFTWSFLQRRIRSEGEEPLFAELSLVSSHAPWTPILPVLDDWGSIGDGEVFEPFAAAGERPEELWRDVDRVREQYAHSVGYAVDVAAAYAERYVDDRTLLIVLGDHQPAPLITGADAPWDVPVHVISGDPDVIEPFLAWGFEKGAWPNPDTAFPTLGMDHFRDWFVRAYSGS